MRAPETSLLPSRLRLALCTIALLSPAVAAQAAPPCGSVVVPAGLGQSTDPAPVPTLSPPLYSGSLYEFEALNLLYRPLLWVNEDHQIDWTESLAASVDADPTRQVFRIRLRPWHWSDGRPVVADDVLYDWRLIEELGPAYSNYRIGGVPDLIRSVRSDGADTLVVSTIRPVNLGWFEIAGLTQFYPLPRQAWTRYTLAEQQTLQSETSFYRVVDGPFRLASLSLGRDAVFVPNERYDGHRPQVARFVMDFLQGANPMEQLEAGQVDMATIPFDLLAASLRLGGFQRIDLGPLPQLYSIIPNLADPAAPFLRDVAVRQAIARGIDQAALIRTVFHGQAVLQYGFVPTSMRSYLPAALRDAPSPLAYDPAAARALLDGAGYRPGADGIRGGRDGRLAMTVLVTAGAEERLLMLQLIQADLARIGIALSIKEVEFNQLIARMLGPPGGWDAVFMGWTILAYPDPTDWFATGSSGNYSHYSNPKMDGLLANATSAPDDGPLQALELFALEQQPMVFLPSGAYTVLARPGIGGIDKFLSTNGMWRPEYLTLGGAMSCDAPHA